MIFQFDSCRKGKIRVICDVGERNYADYLVTEESQYQQVGVSDK